jgi:hypothetical protein
VRIDSRLAPAVLDHVPIYQPGQARVADEATGAFVRTHRVLDKSPGDQLVIQLAQGKAVALSGIFRQDVVDGLDSLQAGRTKAMINEFLSHAVFSLSVVA